MTQNCFGVAVAGALLQALEKAGLKTSEPPPDNQLWLQPMTERPTLQWESLEFGSLKIHAERKYRLGDTEKGRTNIRARVLGVMQNPKDMGFLIEVTAAPGIKILHAKAGEVTDVTNGEVPEFVVPIKWNREQFQYGEKPKGDEYGNPSARKAPTMDVFLPHTRVKGQDNVDIVFLAPDGRFVQLQVSLTTSRDRFWIAAQRTYFGQVVRTTHEKAKEIPLITHNLGTHMALIVPTAPEYAAPGMDYLSSRLYSGMGPKVIDYAVAEKAVAPLGQCTVAEWNPSFEELSYRLKEKGWSRAVVVWYNLTVGCGEMLCEDGELCFIHFKQICGQDNVPIVSEGFPVLEPMERVVLKFNEEDGKRKAVIAKAFLLEAA